MTRADVERIVSDARSERKIPDLRGADLRGADLRGANLRGADLYEANLRGANLRGADLYEANLRGANLRGADLYEADLRGADLRGANLYEAQNIPPSIAASLMVPPEAGAFQAWKKLAGGYLALLQVPEHALRSSATSRKCRVSEATVLKIVTRDGHEIPGPIGSQYDPTFTYEVGKVVKPTLPFDEDRWNECASGIHCFITRQEAKDY